MQKITSLTFLVFDSFSNHCLANALEPLRAANDLSGSTHFKWTLATIDGRNVHSSSGIEFVPSAQLSNLSGDMLVVMPSYNYRAHTSDQVLRSLRATASRFKVLAGYDTGGWLLAKAGLLDDFRATIHPDEFTRFSEAFPNTNAIRQRVIWDRNRVSCAGAASAFEVSMDIISRQLGAAIRLEVALLFMGSDASSQSGTYTSRDNKIYHALNIMRENLEVPISLSQIAESVGLSARNLNTRLKEEFGETSVQIYRRLRLLEVRKLLIETDLSIPEIAVRAGYENVSAMTRAFKNAFGTTPAKLR